MEKLSAAKFHFEPPSRSLHSITSSARASSVAGTSRPSALKVRKSIDLDVRSIHDSCPFLCLCSDEGGEVLGRAHLGFSAELGEDRFHLLSSHNRVNLSVEPVDNRCRGSGGGEHGCPVRSLHFLPPPPDHLRHH